jgi:hypothetical protein
LKLDDKICKSWLRKNKSKDGAYQKDYKDAETYRDVFIIIKTRYDNMFKSVVMDQISKRNNLPTQSLNLNIHLPKPELKKFDGSLKKNWLRFWGQFNKEIKLDDEEKF